MNVSQLLTDAGQTLKSNAPEILTGLGTVGVAATAYLVGKATFAAADVIRTVESEEGFATDPKERLKIRTKMVWRLYVPPALTGVATVACILGASKTHTNRTAAAVAAYSLTEKAFSEYKEKVVEQVGKNKEQKVRDQIAQEKIDQNPPTGEVLVLSGSNVLCCELYTHRYFHSNMETLRKAENEINQRIRTDMYVMLSEFYDQLGLAHTSHSDYMGWDDGKEMELRFSAVVAENGEPCLSFDYSYVKPLH